MLVAMIRAKNSFDYWDVGVDGGGDDDDMT